MRVFLELEIETENLSTVYRLISDYFKDKNNIELILKRLEIKIELIKK